MRSYIYTRRIYADLIINKLVTQMLSHGQIGIIDDDEFGPLVRYHFLPEKKNQNEMKSQE